MLIVAGRLLSVNRPITADEAQGARVIQLRDDQYVLPGIFDVHAHYNMTLGPNGLRSDEWTYNPLSFLANGVTSCTSNAGGICYVRVRVLYEFHTIVPWWFVPNVRVVDRSTYMPLIS